MNDGRVSKDMEKWLVELRKRGRLEDKPPPSEEDENL